MRHDLQIGLMILAGIALALVWRIAVAPAALGDFDPADMAHRDRAFLSIGNVLTAGLFALAQWAIARDARPDVRFAKYGAWAAAAGFACAISGTIGLVFTGSANALLDVYVACTVLAWCVTGLTIFRRFAGVMGWIGAATGLLYVLAAAAILGGAHIIFIMTIAAAPIAFCFLFRRSSMPMTAPASAGHRQTTFSAD